MLREEVYHKMAEVFQTSIGTALPITPKRGQPKPKFVETPMDKKELEIHSIILKAIGRDKYQQLFRKVWELEKKVGRRRIGKNTIYKKAWQEINE